MPRPSPQSIPKHSSQSVSRLSPRSIPKPAPKSTSQLPSNSPSQFHKTAIPQKAEQISHTQVHPVATSMNEGDTQVLLLTLAEEYFAAAHALGPTVASTMSIEFVNKYQKLIATGLGCLESALKNMKLQPRLEAKVRIRYASVLLEETDNFMEAETALSKGIVLCEQV